jgi:hypothetical protein
VKGLLKFHIKRLNYFDEITRFRLILLAIITFLMEIIFPVMSQFYGHLSFGSLEAATIIGIFAFFKQVGAKLVNYILNRFSFSKLFLIVVILDLLWVISTITFFINPIYMIWGDMIISTIQIPFIWAFSTALSNYINYFYPDDFTMFQNYRNDLMAEVGIAGIIFSIILTYISLKVTVIVFEIGMLITFIFQIKYYKRFKKYDFRYMYRYKKSLKKDKK